MQGDETLISVKAVDQNVLRRSVQAMPEVTQSTVTDSSGVTALTDYFVMQIASVADDIVPWGREPKLRDKQLREFFPTENTLLSAFGQIAARNAAFDWAIEGPPSAQKRMQNVLHNANFGEGWTSFVISLTIDLLTQDNGAFVEIIHADPNNPASEVIGIATLDAGRCTRTGDPRAPVIYEDTEKNKRHLLQWWQVHAFAEMPATIKSQRGRQYSALTRVLRAAQILRDVAVYRHEQVTGRHTHRIKAIAGMTTAMIDDAMRQHAQHADDEGRTRYSKPLVIGIPNPDASLAAVDINLAEIPEGFSEDESMRWYINQLAMGLNTDYQEFAPMPGNGLGTATQSRTMASKSRGKGPGLFKKIMVHFLNGKVMPRSCTFGYDNKDTEAEMAEAEVRLQRATIRKTDIESGVVTPQIAQKQAVDDGDLKPEYLAQMGTTETDDDVTITDTDQASNVVDEVEEAKKQPAQETANDLQELAKAIAWKRADRPEWVDQAEVAMATQLEAGLVRARERARKKLGIKEAAEAVARGEAQTEEIVTSLKEIKEAVTALPPTRVVKRVVTRRDKRNLIAEVEEREEYQRATDPVV